jgi:hypothetical protein
MGDIKVIPLPKEIAIAGSMRCRAGEVGLHLPGLGEAPLRQVAVLLNTPCKFSPVE